jgi:hypothetical protein
LKHFYEAVDENFEGENAHTLKTRALSIATVMKINDLPNVKIHTTKYTENKKELYTRFAYNLLVYEPWRQYSVSCQVSLWNRLFLLSILNIKEIIIKKINKNLLIL